MVGLSVTAHANGVILADPRLALDIAESLVAVGAGLTLGHVVTKLGMDRRRFGRAGNLEIELLDADPAGAGMVYGAARGIYSGLLAREMTRGTVHPRLRWWRGLWHVQHDGPGVGGSEFDTPVEMVDLTTLTTPVLDVDRLVS